MAQQNKISVDLDDKDLNASNDAVEVLQKHIVPYLETLPEEEKKELARMGDKTVAFVTKALEYCKTNPSLVPPYLDMEEFERDMDSITKLLGVYRPLLQIVKLLDDSITMAGSDALSAALTFYNALKGAARANVPGADTIYNDLSARFPGRGKGKK